VFGHQFGITRLLRGQVSYLEAGEHMVPLTVWRAGRADPG